MNIDPQEFRKALAAFPTGVTVVTTRDAQGQPRGFTANSFTSVSLNPPLVLVCIAHTAHGHPTFTAAPGFAVNVLAEDQRTVSGVFASKNPDKFAHCAWRPGVQGAPLIEGSVAQFDCRLHQMVEAGDHTILIGEVQALSHGADLRPLGYCRGAYVGYLEERLLAKASGAALRVSAVIETEQGVVLERGGGGRLALPAASSLGHRGGAQGLHAQLEAMGVQARLDFVFSVYEDQNGSCVVYRGRADAPQAPLAPQVLLVPLASLEAQAFVDDATASLLTRYARERSLDTFGVYVGDAAQGEVSLLAPDRQARVLETNRTGA